MVDIQFIREHSELVKEKAQQKGYNIDIDELLRLDNDRKELLQQVESLRQRRNEIATSMQGGRPSDDLINEGKQIKIELAEREQFLVDTESSWLALLKKVPNMPLDDVPLGAGEDENIDVRTWGDKPQFDFEPKNHWQITESRGLIDKERAAKVTGSRFAYIKGGLVHLQFAIVQYVFDTLTNEQIIKDIVQQNNLDVSVKAFVPILPPVMIREEMYDQMDRLEPREDRYHIDGDDDNLWLIGSAEHTMGSMYAGEVLPEADLPIRYIGYSTSFRQEAGTYGKDTEGIIRMHQFDKLEMEVFSTAESGLDEHFLLIAIQEYLMQQLGLPYQVMMKCTGDIGKPNARGVDINAWLPGQNSYRETHTADYMTDYQSRRLMTRVRRDSKRTFISAPEVETSELSKVDPTKSGSKIPIELVHTNDATAFALGRTMVAIIENYQTADGNVRVPEVLRPYINGREIL